MRHPDLYRHVRNLFVIVTGLGLVMHAVYPLAPPRMLPGFIDTIARYGPSIYERSDVASVANQYATMPSMHFGWAVLVAYGAVQTGRRWWNGSSSPTPSRRWSPSPRPPTTTGSTPPRELLVVIEVVVANTAPARLTVSIKADGRRVLSIDTVRLLAR